MKLVNKVALAVMAVMAASGAQAKVLMQDTNVSVGYWFELGSDSEASGKADQSIISASHRTIADWGSIFVKGQLENVGALDDGVNGVEGNVTLKTFVTAYYNLGDTGAQLWYDEFSAGNKFVSENHHYVGAAYGTKFGKLMTKVGVAADYVFGHTPGGNYEGIGAYATRLNLNYPVTKDLMTFTMFEYRWDIADDIAKAHDWQGDAHHLVVGADYRFAKDWSAALVYHNFKQWGAYNNDGDSLHFSVAYHF